MSYDFIECNDYEIIPLGKLELDVYDIEVEDTHNFFANNILVHNSRICWYSKIYRRQWFRRFFWIVIRGW